MPHTKSPQEIAKLRRIQWLNSEKGKESLPPVLKKSINELNRLVELFKGKIVYPGSPDYDKDRQDFDNIYPANPIMIAYVASLEDIGLMLLFAQTAAVETVIRSGGHSLADYSICDGIIIDISFLNSVYVNPTEKFAYMEAGCTFGQVYPVLEQYNLHFPGGDCPSVSIAGFMQGGGYGMTSRAFGMNCDCVESVKVMLSTGGVVVANNSQNKDLFWAIRGGTGGNFGVLLAVEYNLVPLANIFGIQCKWVIDEDPDNAALALYTIQNSYLVLGTNVPQLGIQTVLTTDTDGLKKVFFCATWIGTQEDFETALQPLKNVPGGKFGTIITGKYSYVNDAVLDGTPDLPDDIKAFSRSTYIERSLQTSDWKNILSYFYQNAPNQYTMVDMEAYGGKINTIPETECAFIHRNVTMDFFCDGYFNKDTNDREKNELFLEAFFQFMSQYSNGHTYQNYPNRNQTDFRWAYWGKYYNQLVAIKNKYDPIRFFKYQQSIGPDPDNSLPDQVTLFDPNTPIIYEKY